MSVRDLVRLWSGPPTQERAALSWPAYQQMVSQLNYGGNLYQVLGNTSYGPAEFAPIDSAAAALGSNGVAYGIYRRRLELFAQGKFRFRRFGNPRPTLADSYSTAALAPLDNPRWLLEECELGVARAGAAFFVFDGPELRSLDARYCTIVGASQLHPDQVAGAWDARPFGLMFKVPGQSLDPETWLWDEVFAYIPERDPQARWRGMSWLRPAMEDIDADNGMRRYLTRYLTNHATPNTAVVFPPEVPKETVEAFRDVFLQKHQGVERAFRTAFLGGGADIKVIGASLKELDSQPVRQQVHKDIAAAAGVPIVAAGIEQGTYANSKESNRALADGKVRYLWATVAETFGPAIAVPSGSELYVETAHISALQADALDDAQVVAAQANTMRTLWDGGADPASAISAVTAGDLTKVVHSGNLSVQLVPGGQMPAVAGGK
jgi:hypothetical protein